MREVGHAGRDINDRYTHVLIEAHLAAAEQTAALIREAGKTVPCPGEYFLRPSDPESVPTIGSQEADNMTSPQLRSGGAGGARTHDRRIMRSLSGCSGRTT
jgi:hypothetical protein